MALTHRSKGSDVTNPYQTPQYGYHQPNPYATAPYPAARPRMFGGPLARVVWTLVPVLSLGFLAPLPFVVAAVKRVVAWWLPVTYIVNTIVVMTVVMLTPDGTSLPGLLVIVLMITAATHTALLDNTSVTIGK